MSTMVKREKRTAPRLLDWLESELPMIGGLRLFEPGQTIRCEQYIRDGAIVVRAELPGLDPEKDIEVTVREGVLTISAQRHNEHENDVYSEFFYGSFRRTMSLPSSADPAGTVATYQDGILEVTVKLPTAESADTVKVPITRSE